MTDGMTNLSSMSFEQQKAAAFARIREILEDTMVRLDTILKASPTQYPAIPSVSLGQPPAAAAPPLFPLPSPHPSPFSCSVPPNPIPLPTQLPATPSVSLGTPTTTIVPPILQSSDPPKLVLSPGSLHPISPNPTSPAAATAAPPSVRSSPMTNLDSGDDQEISDPNPDDPVDEIDKDRPPILDHGLVITVSERLASFDFSDSNDSIAGRMRSPISAKKTAPDPDSSATKGDKPDLKPSLDPDPVSRKQMEERPTPTPSRGLRTNKHRSPTRRRHLSPKWRRRSPARVVGDSPGLQSSLPSMEAKVFDGRQAQGGGRSVLFDINILNSSALHRTDNHCFTLILNSSENHSCSWVPTSLSPLPLIFVFSSRSISGSVRAAQSEKAYEKVVAILKKYEARLEKRNGLDYNHLISPYGSLGLKSEIQRIWEIVKMHDVKLDLHGIVGCGDASVNLMLGGLMKFGCFEEALQLFDEMSVRMLEEKAKPNESVFMNIFITLVHWVAMEQGIWVERYVNESVFENNLLVGIARIKELALDRRGKDALRLFSQRDVGTHCQSKLMQVVAAIGNKEFVNCLLNARVDSNIAVEDAMKPIQVAGMRGYKAVVEVLLSLTLPIPNVSEWSVEGDIEHMLSAQGDEHAKVEEPNSQNNTVVHNVKIVAVGPEAKKTTVAAKSRVEDALKRKDYLSF